MTAANRMLIQVVPQLKPAQCGVSDHAIALAQELESTFGIESAFVVLNSDARCSVPYSVVYGAPEGLLAACLSLSRERRGAILVHLSGYGYSADGAPTRLAEALGKVKSNRRLPVAVYFHELFASGMPWTPVFWRSRSQRKAIRRIAEECDLCVTSIRRHADWLEPARRSAAPVELLPVFSTVGQAPRYTPFAARESAIAVFGLGETRQKSYKELFSLDGMLNKLGIREILDIGPSFAAPSEINGIPVRCVGSLESADVVKQLSRTKFGFLSYPPSCLAKSGVFAAYSAQGAVPVIATPFSGEEDGLRDGVHVLSPRTVEAAQTSGLEQCSEAAQLWYSGHSVRAHAATYARWFDELERRLDA
jgi:hypothetical protein